MMIDARNFDLEQRTDLLYDIRDGRVRNEDVIWKDEDLVKNENINISNETTNVKEYLSNSKLIKGDIILIGNKPLVVVDACLANNYIFVSTLDAYVMVETSQCCDYGMSVSGYEHINTTDMYTKIGHIDLTND